MVREANNVPSADAEGPEGGGQVSTFDIWTSNR
jgi:hypothetical protein